MRSMRHGLVLVACAAPPRIPCTLHAHVYCRAGRSCPAERLVEAISLQARYLAIAPARRHYALSVHAHGRMCMLHVLCTARAPQLHAVYCLANCATTVAGLRAVGGSAAPVLLARLAAGSDPTGVLETQARQAARALHVLYTARALHVHCESR